jgi:hypothetical protein
MSLGEFAVEKVAAIQFSDAPESRVRATTEGKFDDIIEGKGQGVIILLQYVSETSHSGLNC